METSPGFQRYSEDLNESVYPQIPCCCDYDSPPPFRFRSRYARKVRVDMWCQKLGCYRTMGPPRAFSYGRPENFLRKHSRYPPVFFDPFVLRNPYFDVNEYGNRLDEEERRVRLGLISCSPPCKVERGERDFLRENALNVIRMPHRRTKRCYFNDDGCHYVDLSDAPPQLNPGFGNVPEYICRRKWELYYEDLYLKRQMEAEKVPQNYRVMDNCERSYLINNLRARWEQLTSEYVCLPGHISDFVLQQKSRLEVELKDIEADLRLLSTCGDILVPRNVENCFCDTNGNTNNNIAENGTQTEPDPRMY